MTKTKSHKINFVTQKKKKKLNMSLIFKAARASGQSVTQSPDEFAREEKDLNYDSLKDTILVTVSQWKRIEVKGKTKMNVVEQEMSKERFITFFMDQRKHFIEHVNRMLQQYDAVRYTKEHLPNNEILVQMDFAENYSCRNADEIQSAYFNPTQVTLHQIVVYYRDEKWGFSI